jgi:copper chaperone NosL
LYGWFATFVLVAIAGLADFWRWSWDFGHNLDMDTAIIKVPGMVYQPPIIGTKQILNFHASSWPHWGGVAACLAMVLAAVAVLVELRRSRVERPAPRRVLKPSSVAAALVGLLMIGCRTGDVPHLAYDDSESCAVCRMAVTDNRYGAALVRTTGKTVRFDSIECLASFYSQLAAGESAGVTAWVTDFTMPGTLMRADSARYLKSDSRRASPMGKGLLAVAHDADATRLQSEWEGTLLEWPGVIALTSVESPPSFTQKGQSNASPH